MATVELYIIFHNLTSYTSANAVTLWPRLFNPISSPKLTLSVFKGSLSCVVTLLRQNVSIGVDPPYSMSSDMQEWFSVASRSREHTEYSSEAYGARCRLRRWFQLQRHF